MNVKYVYKIPCALFIGKQLWEIDYKWRLHDDSGKHCLAYADWVGRIIWLDRAASREDKCVALLDEIIKIALDEGDAALPILKIFKLTLRQETQNAVSRANLKR